MRIPSLLTLSLAAGCSGLPTNANADAIHDRCLTLDTHKDIADNLSPREVPSDAATAREFRLRYDPTIDGKQQVDFVKMKAGGYDCAFYIVYVAQRKLTDSGYARAYAEAKKKFEAIHRMCRMHRDAIGLATSADEVEWLHDHGKLVACIGIENGYPMGTDLRRIEEFHQRGARYMSIAHNGHTQLGDSHTPADEPLHGGLSELGRAAIAEMNRVGVMCDLSHVGSKTSEEVILESKVPVCYSHCAPAGLKDHPRNKSDAELRFIAEHGGFVGVTMFTPFLKAGVNATVDDYVEAIEYVMNLVGEDAIGIGTDFTQGHGQDFFEWLTHDKGYARRLTNFGKIVNPEGIRTIGEFPNLTEALLRRGMSEHQVRKIMGENWLRTLENVWGG